VWNKDVKANVISAVTDEALNDARHGWAKMGFLSRFIVFSYSYSLPTVMAILNRYSDHGLHLKSTTVTLPKDTIDVTLPSALPIS
jgi:hypothetical protein